MARCGGVKFAINQSQAASIGLIPSSLRSSGQKESQSRTWQPALIGIVPGTRIKPCAFAQESRPHAVCKADGGNGWRLYQPAISSVALFQMTSSTRSTAPQIALIV